MLSPLDFLALPLNEAVLELNGKQTRRFRVEQRYLFSIGLHSTAKITFQSGGDAFNGAHRIG
jgi:hypothetical protein